MLNGMRIFQRMPRHGVEMGDRLRRILTERRGRFVSGEEIAGSLGVTRAAVWKGIRTLRGAGYAIEGARGAGYRMTDRPDRIDEGELREALRPGLPWTDVVCLAVTDSTNSVAMEEVGVPPSLKWPNDLYLGERKAAGILAEMASDPDGVRHVVIGVGLNVNMEEADFPPVLRGGAASLRIRAGRTFRRVDVLARMLDAFGTRYGEFLEGGFHALHPGWDRRAFLSGIGGLFARLVGHAWPGGAGVRGLPGSGLGGRRAGGGVGKGFAGGGGPLGFAPEKGGGLPLFRR